MSWTSPFDLYGIDPREGPAGITARFRELIEDARDDAERDRLRTAWEELTLHPARRLRAALLAHPETRPPLGLPPLVSRAAARGTIAEITGDDLVLSPSVVTALSAAGPPAGRPVHVSPHHVALEDDPHLRR